jgi:hypothetical protein
MGIHSRTSMRLRRTHIHRLRRVLLAAISLPVTEMDIKWLDKDLKALLDRK